jgi:predicted AlkP superfamily phosphohydrolase/phosphomutase
LGWPQDTTALEDGCITDDQFLALCDSILETRERLLMHHLGRFQEGILASVFDSLDRVQHMFWRDRPDIVDDWYVKLDALVGRVKTRLSETGRDQVKLVVVSDHGFTDLDYKVHLNRWLVERGYLSTTAEGASSGGNGQGRLQDADWSKSQAYAIGLNSLYLNLAGREGRGSVSPAQRDAVVNQLRQDLLDWKGTDGRAVVANVYQQSDVFDGPLAAYGPDLVVGYAPGYRASAETGLGKWDQTCIEPNHDHWGADHCIDAHIVPGVLFCDQGLAQFTNPTYRDFPSLTVQATLDSSSSAPPTQSQEDERAIEERLKGLGYL